MPIYEYRCESCAHEFERLMKIGSEAPSCPECGNSTRKKVSAAGFVLKGSGWYKDHYGLKKSETKIESKSDSKSDSANKGPAPKKTESAAA